jgi:lipid-A-disaccharide synthase
LTTRAQGEEAGLSMSTEQSERQETHAWHICIAAGEASGDMQGALLVDELRRREPNLEFAGLGSTLMQDAGVRLVEDCRGLSAIGFIEAAKKFPRGFFTYHRLKRLVRSGWADLLILIDFPIVNLRLARYAKGRGFPVVYYFPPGAWTEKNKRAVHVARHSSKIITPFPMSAKAYAEAGADVRFVGHPLIDTLRPGAERRQQKMAPCDSSPVVAILPGSRHHEIRHILPSLLAAARIIKSEMPGAEFGVSVAPTASREQIAAAAGRQGLNARIVAGTHELLETAHVALVASGTATLEAAILGVPMVVVYRAGLIPYIHYRYLYQTTLEAIGMPNILAGGKIVPELIQYEASPEGIAEAALRYLRDEEYASATTRRLGEAVSKLGNGGALRQAGDIIVAMLHSLPTRSRYRALGVP